jgi:hypothetical protein
MTRPLVATGGGQQGHYVEFEIQTPGGRSWRRFVSLVRQRGRSSAQQNNGSVKKKSSGRHAGAVRGKAGGVNRCAIDTNGVQSSIYFDAMPLVNRISGQYSASGNA